MTKEDLDLFGARVAHSPIQHYFPEGSNHYMVIEYVREECQSVEYPEVWRQGKSPVFMGHRTTLTCKVNYFISIKVLHPSNL